MSFINAKVVGSGITPGQYLHQEVDRGHPDYVLSRSDLVELMRCPARWRAGYSGGKETDATERGSLWDCLLLDAPAFGKRYAVEPQTYTTTGMECPSCKSVTESQKCSKCKMPRVEIEIVNTWNNGANICKEWHKRNAGIETCKQDELDEARSAVACVELDLELSGIIASSQTQVMVVGEWQDRATGMKVPLRALLDVVPDVDGPFGKFLLDYKTTTSAELRAYTRSVDKFRLDTQAALHLDLYVAATGEDRNTFGHIVQESFPPFHVEKRILSLEFMDLGRGIYLHGLRTYCQCMKRDVWPGYPAPNVINGWQLAEPEAFMISRPVDFEFPVPAGNGFVSPEDDIIP